MDPLAAKTLADALNGAPAPARRRATPHRRTVTVPARGRVAVHLRRWADRLEPRTSEPAVCTG